MYCMKNLRKNQKEKTRQWSCDIAGSSRSAQSVLRAENSHRQRTVELEKSEDFPLHRLRAAERAFFLKSPVEVPQVGLETREVGPVS